MCVTRAESIVIACTAQYVAQKPWHRQRIGSAAALAPHLRPLPCYAELAAKLEPLYARRALNFRSTAQTASIRQAAMVSSGGVGCACLHWHQASSIPD